MRVLTIIVVIFVIVFIGTMGFLFYQSMTPSRSTSPDTQIGMQKNGYTTSSATIDYEQPYIVSAQQNYIVLGTVEGIQTLNQNNKIMNQISLVSKKIDGNSVTNVYMVDPNTIKVSKVVSTTPIPAIASFTDIKQGSVLQVSLVADLKKNQTEAQVVSIVINQ